MHGRPWGFYGRKREMDTLRRSLDTDLFRTIAVIGGRRVGKTELIKEVMAERHNLIHIYLRIPERDKTGENEHPNIQTVNALRELNMNMATEIRNAGLTGFPEPETLGDDLINHVFHFKETLETLFRQGCTVTMDEFQNITRLSLVNAMRDLIDELGGLGPKQSNDGGVLVIAGSHQQRMLEILYHRKSPLYDRQDTTIRLKPLRTPDLLEMAADQGWLTRPYRFLTAYTVLGGMPHRWKRLAEEIRQGLLPEPQDDDDNAWSQMFLEHEFKRVLEHPEESFLNTAYVEMKPEPHSLAMELTRNPKGVRWSQLVQQFRKDTRKLETPMDIEAAFDILENHLRIAEPVPGPGRQYDPNAKLRLCDQAVLFELQVRRHHQRHGPHETPVHLLQDMEGLAFERLCAQWFDICRQYKIVRHSVEIEGLGQQNIEIDMVAERKHDYHDGRPRSIALAACKRNPNSHAPGKTRHDFDLYLKARADGGDAWLEKNTRRLLLSPDWPDAGYPDDGFRRMDIEDMAELMNLTLYPWPEPDRKRRDEIGLDFP